VNQKQLLENGTVGLYELYFRLPVNVSYKILYNPGHFNSDMNKLLTRQLDLKNISNLNLSNNQIGDEGAKLLADSLAKGQMPKLKVLHLHGNKITDEGTKLFIKALESPNVTEVSIILRIANKADEVKDFVVETIGEIKDFITKGLNYAVEQHSQKQWEINKIRTNVEGEKWRDCKDTAINFGMGLASGGIKCAPLVEMPIAMGVCIVKDAGIGLLQPETLGCIADINDFFGD
jgi:hypothetical protein